MSKQRHKRCALQYGATSAAPAFLAITGLHCMVMSSHNMLIHRPDAGSTSTGDACSKVPKQEQASASGRVQGS